MIPCDVSPRCVSFPPFVVVVGRCWSLLVVVGRCCRCCCCRRRRRRCCSSSFSLCVVCSFRKKQTTKRSLFSTFQNQHFKTPSCFQRANPEDLGLCVIHPWTKQTRPSLKCKIKCFMANKSMSPSLNPETETITKVKTDTTITTTPGEHLEPTGEQMATTTTTTTTTATAAAAAAATITATATGVGAEAVLVRGAVVE